MSIAVFCLKGHPDGILNDPEILKDSAWHDSNCAICGSPKIDACPHCHKRIEFLGVLESDRPAYCGGCQNPFPWTRNQVLRELRTDEAQQLNQDGYVCGKRMQETFLPPESVLCRNPIAYEVCIMHGDLEDRFYACEEHGAQVRNRL
jgi:hypothetical protein